MGIYIFVSVLVIVACVFQVLIVLVQNSKGGGLAANFTSAGQSMGIRKTADFLEKATWTLAGTLLFFCLISSITTKSKEAAPKSALEENARATQDASKPIQFPTQSTDKNTNKTSTPAQTTNTPEEKGKK